MLNELQHLAGALKSAGIKPVDWHKELKLLPKVSNKKPCYKISLAADNTVANVQVLDPALAGTLRKWEPSNGDSFPGFNIRPIYRIAEEEQKRVLKKWREGKELPEIGKLKDWCAATDRNWDNNAVAKARKCLRKIPQELLEILGDIPREYNELAQVIDRAEKLEIAGSLETYIWKRLEKWQKPESGNDDIALLLSILIYEGDSAKKAEDDRGGSLSVFLDISDWNNYPVAHERMMAFLNERLLNKNTFRSSSKFGVDAFGSKSEEGDQKDKLPEVKLPILGGVKLRAMNSESPCQFRYGTIDAASFPIGQESRKQTKGALEWLGNPALEGQTWGRAAGKELIFAYPGIIPATPPKLVTCLGARKEGDKSARFIEYARDIIGQLKGINRDLKQVELHVFSLRKMDKARTKVVFHRNYSAERLAIAADKWESGCGNIPVISIHAWGEEKGAIADVFPETPFPLQIASYLNRVWKMDGSTDNEVDVVAPTIGIELFFNAKDTRYLFRLLSIAIQNSKGLFLSMGGNMHKGERISLAGYEKQKQFMPSILGLLLHKSGIGKEQYMANAPYLIGNLLKVADDLHALYCREVRKGNLPPQLIGNSLMVAALESPVQALSQLALRLPPYLGWARTNNTEKAGLSRYFMKCFGEIEAKIQGQPLPIRLNDAERAQLLLGYLATLEKSGSTN